MQALVLEDDPLIARLIQLILAEYGIDSKVAHKAEDADWQDADLITVDALLPGGMDGVTFAKHVRETSDIPIVFITGSVDPYNLMLLHEISPYVVRKPDLIRDQSILKRVISRCMH